MNAIILAWLVALTTLELWHWYLFYKLVDVLIVGFGAK